MRTDALLTTAARRLRIPAAVAATAYLSAEREHAVDRPYLELARHVLRGSGAAQRPAVGWREATEEAVAEALASITPSAKRDWQILHPQVLLVSVQEHHSSIESNGAPVVVRCEGRTLWIDQAVERLERAYPGARLLLLAALDRVEPVVDIFAPWRLFGEAEHVVWFGNGTTADFVSQLAAECEVEFEEGETAQALADRMGWYTPTDYAQAVPADLLPPGVFASVLKELGRTQEVDEGRPGWSETEAGLLAFAGRQRAQARRRKDSDAISIFEHVAKVLAVPTDRTWDWGGYPNPWFSGTVMVDAGMGRFADEIAQRHQDCDYEGTHALFGQNGETPAVVIERVAEYLDRVASVDTLLHALNELDDVIAEKKGDARGAT